MTITTDPFLFHSPPITTTMADDTRLPPSNTREDLSKEALTVDPTAKAFSGSQWSGAKENETYSPPANANAMAGGTQHTAGGKVPEVTISNAFGGSLKMQDFYDLPKKPCVRDALLTGIGVGFALGGLRVVFKCELDPHSCISTHLSVVSSRYSTDTPKRVSGKPATPPSSPASGPRASNTSIVCIDDSRRRRV